MTPEQIQAYIIAAQLLVVVGKATIGQIKGMFKGSPMTEEEQNTVLRWVEDDARRRKALAEGDAGLAPT